MLKLLLGVTCPEAPLGDPLTDVSAVVLMSQGGSKPNFGYDDHFTPAHTRKKRKNRPPADRPAPSVLLNKASEELAQTDWLRDTKRTHNCTSTHRNSSLTYCLLQRPCANLSKRHSLLSRASSRRSCVSGLGVLHHRVMLVLSSHSSLQRATICV